MTIRALSRPKTLAERLLRKRREKGLTQQQLGELVGSTYSAIQKIEAGCSQRPRIANRLAAALGVNPSWLLYGEGPESGLEAEAKELGQAWLQLPEPYRSIMQAKLHFYAGKAGLM